MDDLHLPGVLVDGVGVSMLDLQLCIALFQKADVEKQLVSAKTASQEVAQAKAEIEAKLEETVLEKLKVEETYAMSANAAESQISALKGEKEVSVSENLVRKLWSQLSLRESGSILFIDCC